MYIYIYIYIYTYIYIYVYITLTFVVICINVKNASAHLKHRPWSVSRLVQWVVGGAIELVWGFVPRQMAPWAPGSV